MQVVDGGQSAAQDFPGLEKVPDIGAGVPGTSRAAAFGIDGAGVLGEFTVLDDQPAIPGQHRAGAGHAGRQHAVKHVDAHFHAGQDVVGKAHAHQVARFFQWQQSSGQVGHFAHGSDRLATDNPPIA